MTDLVETLCWLVDIPSVTGDESRLRDAIAKRLESMRPQSVGDSLVVGEPREKAILLVGHLDTVPLQGHVGATVEDGRVHGLGATDMKSGLAVMIHLLEAVGPDRIVCIFYAGEEGPLSGNQLGMILDAAPWLRTAEAAIVMEPTDKGLEAGCQGVVNAEVTFEGAAAHSARPWLGDNAITKAGEFLTRMRALEPELHVVGGLEFREVMSVTTALGGVAKNIIPAAFSLNVNYRFAPDRSLDEAISRIHAVCAAADRVVVADSAPAGAVNTDHPLFRALVEVSAARIAG
ncbi:MAG: M20/M25/M40 family metallo-hydrolase [Actinomycetota bacterium]|nr:M20/M25/M40 family metallo-hydrolase [Actinomycetota bacterium]